MKKSDTILIDLFLKLRCLKPESAIIFYLKKIDLTKQILSL